MAPVITVFQGERRLVPSGLAGLPAGVTITSVTLYVQQIGGLSIGSPVSVQFVQAGTGVQSSVFAESRTGQTGALGLGSYRYTFIYFCDDSEVDEDFVVVNIVPAR